MFGDTVIAKYLSIPSHQKRELTRETKKLGRRDVLLKNENVAKNGAHDNEPNTSVWVLS